MATQEQERRSPPLETAKSASDEPQLLGLVPITGGSAPTMATGEMAAGGGGAGKEEERGLEVPLDNVRSSSPSVAPLSVVGGSKPCSSDIFASPQCPHFQRKPRSHVHRAAPPSHQWGFKLPVLPPAPAKKKRAAKKRDKPCAICGATKTPLWRTWPTDRRVMLCNSCGIRVRAPGTVLPELVYLPHPATATTTAVSELEQPVAPPQEIQPILDSLRPAVLPEKVHVHLPPPATARTTVVSELEQQPPPQEIQDPESPPEPDSPILESMKDVNVYLLRRTSLPPPQTAEPAPAVAVLAAGNEGDKPEKWCLHCGTTSSLQWRTGPAGESTLCNPCGVRYRQGRLVPEYRPRASPTFNQAEHSYKHREVLKIREKHDHPAPPPLPAAALKPIRTRKRRNGKGQQQQPAQVHKKHKGINNKVENQAAAQAQPAPAATQQRAGNDMLQNLPPPPPSLSPPAETMPAAAAPAPGNDEINNKPEKWCLHCGITSTLRWRTGPLGESTLCNACGVRYRQGRLVPEYRPRASPTFNESEHSYKHHEVVEIRKKQDHPAPPASFKLTKRRRKGKGQQQPASSQEGQGQGEERACTQAQAQPACQCKDHRRRTSDRVIMIDDD